VTEQELTRRAKRRLAILRHAEEITGNVALTCRYYGISRQVFYKWRQRYDQHGLDGLRDRSRGPRVCPNQTRTEVVGKIIYLRQHDHFGPAKIAMYLQRYHDIQIRHSSLSASLASWASRVSRLSNSSTTWRTAWPISAGKPATWSAVTSGFGAVTT
jgi:transposase-like protein